MGRRALGCPKNGSKWKFDIKDENEIRRYEEIGEKKDLEGARREKADDCKCPAVPENILIGQFKSVRGPRARLTRQRDG